jgi:hypothetical protein
MNLDNCCQINSYMHQFEGQPEKIEEGNNELAKIEILEFAKRG